MPEAHLFSHHPSHSSHASHDLTASSNAAVPVAVQTPWNLSSSAPTDSRLDNQYYHQHYQSQPNYPGSSKPSHAHKSSLSLSHATSLNPVSFTGRASSRPPPRTSSLLPPPHIEPASHSNRLEVPGRQPSPGATHVQTPETSPRSAQGTTASRSPSNNPAEVSWLLNRWSTSTAGSSRTSLLTHRAPHSRFGSRGSVDATNIVNKSPPTARPSPRKLQKNRRPSLSSRSDDVPAPAPLPQDNQASRTLPPIASLSPLEPPNLAEFLQITVEGAGPGPTEHRLPSHVYQESQSPIAPGTAQSTNQIITAKSIHSNPASVSQTTMPYDYDGEAHTPRGVSRGHSRSRSGKGSNDKGRGTKPPSQKAMLSRALQKANTAVQLDNAQNFEGAREAYAEACELLRQVLQRTTGDEDKRKLEAIVS